MRRSMLGVAMATLAAVGFSAPALAQYGGDPDYELEDRDGKDDAYGEDAADDRQGKYEEGAGVEADVAADVEADQSEDDYRGETWRDNEGRLRCRRSDGTTGLIVGGAAGALVGRGIDTRGERGTGTVIGGAVGALIGRAIERGARCQ
jgi:hypothetical protein